MGVIRVISISVLIAVLAMAVSCGGKSVSLSDQFEQWAAAQDFTTSLGTDASGLPSIPLDSGTPERGVSTEIGDNLVVLGSDFMQKLNAEVDGTSLVMQAPAEGEGEGPYIAYGLYKVSGLLDKRPTIMNFDCLPKLIDQPYYVGLADYTQGEWMWFGPIYTPEYEINVGEINHQFVTQLGNMYFVLVSPPGCGATHNQTTIFFGPPGADDLPGAPHGLIASDGEFAEAVGLVWEPGARANYYEIWRGGPMQGANPAEWAKIGEAETCEYLDTTVTPGVVYGYKVRSINTAGHSEFSNPDNGYAGEQPPPPQDGFVIEGNINWPGQEGVPGDPVPGVVVKLLGLQDMLAQETNADGHFRFPNLPAGKYIVVPAAPDKWFGIVGGDRWYQVLVIGQEVPVGHADFIARAEELPAWRAWGFAFTFVSNEAGAVGFTPLAGVVMTITAGENTYTVQTNEDGFFSQPELPVGVYYVTPGKDGYTFTPETAEGHITGQSMQPPMFFRGFAGDPPPPPSGGVIEAVVRWHSDPAMEPVPLAGCQVMLLGLESETWAQTDQAGNVRFGDLPFGTYIVMPYDPHKGFDPAYAKVVLNAEHSGQGLSFTGFVTDNYYRVFGFVYSFLGEAPNHFAPMVGTLVQVKDPETQNVLVSVETNADGFYQATQLPLGSLFDMPVREGYSFSPETHSFTITGESVVEPLNFLGAANVP